MKRYISIIFLALSLCTCSSYKSINIDILRPAAYTFPKGTQSIVLLNNADEQSTMVGHYSYKQDMTTAYESKRKKISDDYVNVDSTTTMALYNMSNKLNEINIFPPIKVGRFENTPKINNNNIIKYFDQYKTDAIIVLEDVSSLDEFTKLYYSYFNVVEEELKVTSATRWKIYNKDKNISYYTYEQLDTIYWTAQNINREVCIQEAIWENAAKASNHIIPYWITVNRVFFTGSGFIYNDIEKKVSKNQWEDAAKYWMQIYNGENKNTITKGRMAYNMALFFELKNNIPSAIEWINTASNIFKENNDKAKDEISICNTYNGILYKRTKMQKQLEEQYN